MAIITGGLHGLARKKVGNVVYRDWRNMIVASAYNPNVQNPKTVSQETVRTRFALISTLAKKMAVAITMGFKNYCAGTKVPARSMFIKKNFNLVSMASPDEAPEYNWEDMLVADGPLASPIFGEPSFNTAGAIKFSHTPNEQDLVSGRDEVYCVVYNMDKKRAQVLAAGLREDDTDITLLMPTAWAGDRVKVWGFCLSPNNETLDVNGVTREQKKGDASPSVYIGAGEIS